MSHSKIRIIYVGGTKRAFTSLKKILQRNDIEILFAIFQKDYPHDEQWHPMLEKLAGENNIQYITYDSMDKLHNETKLKIQNLKADVIICGGVWRIILTEDVLRSARHGFIGVHGSLLPEYRGFAGINWYVINNEKEYGMQLFQLNEKIDGGLLVYRNNGTSFKGKINLNTEKTMGEILNEADELTSSLLMEFLDVFKRKEFKLIKQNENDATWTCHRGPDDGEINWRRSTLEIYNFIRAQSHPYPGAFSYYKNKKFKIWTTSIPQNSKKFVGRIPGKVVDRTNNYVEVLTGDGILRLEEITVDNKKIIPSKFINSIRETLGYNQIKAFQDFDERISNLEKNFKKINYQ